MYRQCTLEYAGTHTDGSKVYTRLTAWFDRGEELAVGKQVTLKDDDDGRLWVVVACNTECRDKPPRDMYRTWKNNI